MRTLSAKQRAITYVMLPSKPTVCVKHMVAQGCHFRGFKQQNSRVSPAQTKIPFYFARLVYPLFHQDTPQLTWDMSCQCPKLVLFVSYCGLKCPKTKEAPKGASSTKRGLPPTSLPPGFACVQQARTYSNLLEPRGVSGFSNADCTPKSTGEKLVRIWRDFGYAAFR